MARYISSGTTLLLSGCVLATAVLVGPALAANEFPSQPPAMAVPRILQAPSAPATANRPALGAILGNRTGAGTAAQAAPAPQASLAVPRIAPRANPGFVRPPAAAAGDRAAPGPIPGNRAGTDAATKAAPIPSFSTLAWQRTYAPPPAPPTGAGNVAAAAVPPSNGQGSNSNLAPPAPPGREGRGTLAVPPSSPPPPRSEIVQADAPPAAPRTAGFMQLQSVASLGQLEAPTRAATAPVEFPRVRVQNRLENRPPTNIVAAPSANPGAARAPKADSRAAAMRALDEAKPML